MVMRVAVIADIHGNLPALEAVLAGIDLEAPDLVVSCGDVASGPLPVQTLDVLRALPPAPVVRSNAHRALITALLGGPLSGLPGPAAELSAARMQRLPP